jgi:hypothetical protein
MVALFLSFATIVLSYCHDRYDCFKRYSPGIVTFLFWERRVIMTSARWFLCSISMRAVADTGSHVCRIVYRTLHDELLWIALLTIAVNSSTDTILINKI